LSNDVSSNDVLSNDVLSNDVLSNNVSSNDVSSKTNLTRVTDKAFGYYLKGCPNLSKPDLKRIITYVTSSFGRKVAQNVGYFCN
jgi:hypothetical protein